jgi:long-chain acyl-CoA synthetase
MDHAWSEAEQDRTSLRPRHLWEGWYPAEVHWDMPIEAMTLPEMFERSVARFADRPAIEYHDRQTSFASLGDLVDRLAAGFLREGLGAGRTVALFLPNTPWHAACFFAVLKAGARLVHLSPLDAQREIAFKLTDSGADAVVTTDLFGLADKALEHVDTGAIRRLFVGQDAYWGGAPNAEPAQARPARNLETLLDAPAPASWPSLKPADIALLQYTGGTTGLPKGAILTHGNMTAATQIYQAWQDEFRDRSGGERVIGVLPMFHVYALGVVLLLNIAEGNEILLRPRFDLATTWRDIEEKRATAFPAVPTMLIALLSDPTAAARDFSSLVMLGSGGAPMPQDVATRLEAVVGRSIRSGWGMTETSAAGSRIPDGAPKRPGLIGVPLCRIELRIVSLTDPACVLPPGEVGELAVRGPNVTQGYWNQQELSQTSFVDGFFLTGDIGTMDADGLFTIVDRKKRMILSGGFNVYPAMIEQSIYEHPDVEEAIVIGVPDPYRGEAAKAFIKLRDGAVPMTLDVLRLFLGERVGKHELPTALELRESLPKSAVGKLLASQLVDEERARTLARVEGDK